MSHTFTSRLETGAAANRADLAPALEELFSSIERLRPTGTAPDWLLRPDFDWSGPLRAEEHAEASARKMLMFSSARYLQALAGQKGPDTRLMGMALKQIEDAEALEVVCEVSRLLRAFATRWGLADDTLEQLANWYSERAEAASRANNRPWSARPRGGDDHE